nr:hypothetical protein [Tanacetum cinerariifolium]
YPCEGLSSNKIGGFCQLGFGQDYMGRSGKGLGYYSDVLQGLKPDADIPLKLVFTFPGELWSSSRVPPDLDDRYTTLL